LVPGTVDQCSRYGGMVPCTIGPRTLYRAMAVEMFSHMPAYANVPSTISLHRRFAVGVGPIGPRLGKRCRE